ERAELRAVVVRQRERHAHRSSLTRRLARLQVQPALREVADGIANEAVPDAAVSGQRDGQPRKTSLLVSNDRAQVGEHASRAHPVSSHRNQWGFYAVRQSIAIAWTLWRKMKMRDVLVRLSAGTTKKP